MRGAKDTLCGCKSKKWIAETVERMNSRYGDPKLVPQDHIKFATNFGKDWAPKVAPRWRAHPLSD